LGNSVRTTMQKKVYYFGGSARRRTRETHPADAIVGAGRVGRGLGKGGGVLLARLTALLEGDSTDGERDGSVIVVA
jgi:hypothetical protein